MRLDTVPELMPAAARMYRALGFRDVPAADDTDVPGIVGMERAVRRLRPGAVGSI